MKPSAKQGVPKRKLSWLEKANFKIFEPLEISHSFINCATAVKPHAAEKRLSERAKLYRAAEHELQGYKKKKKLPPIAESKGKCTCMPEGNSMGKNTEHTCVCTHDNPLIIDKQFLVDRPDRLLAKKKKELPQWLIKEIEGLTTAYFVHSLYVGPYWRKVSDASICVHVLMCKTTCYTLV